VVNLILAYPFETARSHLIHEYNWSQYEKDDSRISGIPDTTKFKRVSMAFKDHADRIFDQVISKKMDWIKSSLTVEQR
jgi:hypothetical protein